MLEELDLKVQEENERNLNEATANIIERQNRLEKEKETQKAMKDESNVIGLEPITKVKTGKNNNSF